MKKKFNVYGVYCVSAPFISELTPVKYFTSYRKAMDYRDELQVKFSRTKIEIIALEVF